MRVRVILQTETSGIIFDDDGVRGISARDIDTYRYIDGKPCCLLVSADGPKTSPLEAFDFCNATIVVTSPNLNSHLESWEKQVRAKRFVATPPSCLEMVYLLYVKFFKYSYT
jgi:hypothetical protein